MGETIGSMVQWFTEFPYGETMGSMVQWFVSKQPRVSKHPITYIYKPII